MVRSQCNTNGRHGITVPTHVFSCRIIATWLTLLSYFELSRNCAFSFNTYKVCNKRKWDNTKFYTSMMHANARCDFGLSMVVIERLFCYISAPRIFEVLWNTAAAALTQHTRDSVFIYGYVRLTLIVRWDWTPYFLKNCLY